MKGYNLNLSQQASGELELHTEDCRTPPYLKYIYLGEFASCADAMVQAKEIITAIKALENVEQALDGCRTCCSECHTK